MGEIDVTEVTAIEYLEKFVKIKKKETCNEDINCCDCKYETTSCLNKIDYIDLDIKDHIQRVMDFELPKLKINWSKVEKDTLLEVTDNNKRWYRRYFAEYRNETIYCYSGGCTSKTACDTTPWEYARMIDDDDE
jgi:hypothetical protein|nr:MAG TPA: hypothetical protein [Caudoviricetes sp.]